MKKSFLSALMLILAIGANAQNPAEWQKGQEVTENLLWTDYKGSGTQPEWPACLCNPKQRTDNHPHAKRPGKESAPKIRGVLSQIEISQ